MYCWPEFESGNLSVDKLNGSIARCNRQALQGSVE